MTSKKIIVVTGATGLQGGSVARFLLNNGTFSVRAVTRDPEKPAAKALVEKGAEVVKADLRDLESLKKVFEGAYGVFGLTNYWEPGVGGEGEVKQGKLLVDAARATGIKHFIWSTLDRSPFKADHWESKSVVDEYLKEKGVPRTSLYTTFQFENFAGMMRPRKRDDGSYDFPMPLITDATFAVYTADETGAYALAAFLHPETWLNKDMRIATEFLSAREMAKIMSEVKGKTVHVQEIDAKTFDTFKDNGIPQEVHANMLVLFANPEPPFRDTTLAHKLYPEIKSFRQWVRENVDKIFPN